MMLVTAWILLDEISYYTMNRILGILASSVLIIIGIKIITAKTSVVAQIKKKKRPSEPQAQVLADNALLQSVGSGPVLNPEESDTNSLNASRLTFESQHSNVFLSESDMSGETIEDKREKQRETAIAQIVRVMLGRDAAEPVMENLRSAKNSNSKKFNLADS